MPQSAWKNLKKLQKDPKKLVKIRKALVSFWVPQSAWRNLTKLQKDSKDILKIRKSTQI